MKQNAILYYNHDLQLLPPISRTACSGRFEWESRSCCMFRCFHLVMVRGEGGGMRADQHMHAGYA
jgi:hypothetical protein